MRYVTVTKHVLIYSSYELKYVQITDYVEKCHILTLIILTLHINYIDLTGSTSKSNVSIKL